MSLPVLLRLLRRRGAGVSNVLNGLGLFAVTVYADLSVRGYVIFGGSDKGLIRPALRSARRGATCLTNEAWAYGSFLLGR